MAADAAVEAKAIAASETFSEDAVSTAADAAAEAGATAASETLAEDAGSIQESGSIDTDAAAEAEATAASETLVEDAGSSQEVGSQPRLKKKKGKKQRAAGAAAELNEAAVAPVVEMRGAILESAEDDKKGIVHLVDVPSFMQPATVRHMMEQFGEVGRMSLTGEGEAQTTRRKKLGNKDGRTRYTEGWVEFLDRRLAKRVADSLNGTLIGGKKRNNSFHDCMWNLQYLPKFKWSQLREGATYNRMVRKARLDQKLNQARRENSLFLERVQQNNVKTIVSKKRAARAGKSEGSGAASGERSAPGKRNSWEEHKRPKLNNRSDNTVSDHVLRSLFACD